MASSSSMVSETGTLDGWACSRLLRRGLKSFVALAMQHGEAREQPETSAGDDVIPRPSVTVPFVGEIRSLLAVKDVMYPQTTAVRRRLLNVRHRIARDEDRGLIDSNAPVRREALRGATIQINRSPFEIPDDYRSGTDAPAARAQAAIAKLGEQTRDSWAAEADRNRRVKTTLSRVAPERAESPIRPRLCADDGHSHVLLDYPLLDVPLRQLVTPDSSTRAASGGP